MSVRSSKYRWLMCGTFSPVPDGRKRAVSGERFATVMQQVGVRAEVLLPPTLGDKDLGRAELEFDRPRKFKVGEVIAALDPLRQLQALADTLDRDRDIVTDVAAARIEKIVGAGGLAQRIRQDSSKPAADKPPVPPDPTEAAEAEAPSDPPASNQDSEPASSAVDAIFAKVEAPQASATATAKSGLDAFIGAMRSGKQKSVRVDAKVVENVSAKIRQEVSEVAIAALGNPTLARIESSWRGLKMVVSEAPQHEKLAIDLLNATPENLLEALEKYLVAADPSRPDAVFIGVVVPPSAMAPLAALAESSGVPIVVGVGEATTGHVWSNPEEESPMPDWAALRRQSCADWLGAAANPVVLYNEDAPGTDPRVVLGSAAWGVAALLAASIKRGDGPNRAVGPAGAVVSPAAIEADVGFADPRTIPTATYADLQAQKRAAEHGVILLGSEPGSDQVLVATLRMAGGNGSLPACIQSAAGRRA